jgi:hypothetical protein
MGGVIYRLYDKDGNQVGVFDTLTDARQWAVPGDRIMEYTVTTEEQVWPSAVPPETVRVEIVAETVRRIQQVWREAGKGDYWPPYAYFFIPGLAFNAEEQAIATRLGLDFSNPHRLGDGSSAAVRILSPREAEDGQAS